VNGESTTPGASRIRDVLLALSISDFRIRYGRGRARVVKWLLDPIAALGIYLALVVVVLDRSGPAPGLSLACAVVPFQLVMMTFVNSLRCIEMRRSILLNLSVPRGLIPLASAVTESIAFAAALTIPFVMMLVYGVAPTVSILWLLPAVALTFLLAVSIGYVGALLGFWLPELVSFFVSSARALFFLAPGLIAYDQIDAQGRDLLPANPLTGIFETYRDAFLYGQAPEAWQLLIPLAASILVLAVALPVYLREAPHLAKAVTGSR
jgi:ABC-type polysaccharide/polyol phosphate export permease